MDAPCRDCPDRVVEPNCHMTCEKYLEFQAYRQALIDSRRDAREYKQYRAVISDRVQKCYRRMSHLKRFRNQ